MSMTINASGGGAGLNFYVVGNSVEPAHKENMIWVNTGTPVKGYSFSRFPPSSPVNGDVWFRTAQNSSPVEFNALKKNVAMIYPQSCFQYEDGSWVEKAAKTWMNGAWENWYTYYYYLGNQETNLTGGWKTVTGSNGEASLGDEYISLGYHSGGGRSAQAYTVNTIDVSGKNALKFEIELVSTDGGNVYCGLSTNNTASEGTNNLLSWCNASVITQLTQGDKAVVTYDISNISGTLGASYYARVGIGISEIKVYRVWCE